MASNCIFNFHNFILKTMGLGKMEDLSYFRFGMCKYYGTRGCFGFQYEKSSSKSTRDGKIHFVTQFPNDPLLMCSIQFYRMKSFQLEKETVKGILYNWKIFKIMTISLHQQETKIILLIKNFF